MKTERTELSREKHRLNFDFEPERVKEIKELMAEMGVGSMKELLNNALTLLEWSLSEAKKGYDIAAINEDDKSYRVLVTPFLQRAKKSEMRLKPTLQEGLHAAAS